MAGKSEGVLEAEHLYYRLVLILLQTATVAVRRCFDREFSPDKLTSSLNKIQSKIKSDRKRYGINKTQIDLLYSSGPEQVTSSKFDISLMTCLLKHFTSLKITDDLPMQNHDGPGPDISRIKYYRNVIMHFNDFKSKIECHSIWTSVTKAIERVGGEDVKKMIEELSSMTFTVEKKNKIENDLQKEKELEELRDEVRARQALTKNKNEMRKSKVDAWKKDDENFVKTESTKYIQKQLETQRGVIIFGHPGCGKSANAQHVAFVLEKNGYKIIPCSSPDDITTNFDEQQLQVFVMNDICGKYIIDHNRVDDWTEKDEGIEGLIKNSVKTKFIVTSRIDIFENKYFPGLKCLKLKECKLFNLTVLELRSIAASYNLADTVKDLTDSAISEFESFPLMCTIYSNMEVRNPDFFKKPREVFEMEINKMRHKNASAFVALCLLVIYNNKIEKEWFDSTHLSNMQIILQKLCSEMEITDSVSPISVQNCLMYGLSVYIKESTASYVSRHDKMFDIVSNIVTPCMFQSLLDHGDIRFIAERIKFGSLYDDQCIYSVFILLPNHYELRYFERFDEELKKGNYREVFGNIQTENALYRETYLEYLSKIRKTKKYVDFHMNCFYKYGKGRATPMFISASKGYVDFVQHFLNYQPYQAKRLDEHGRSPLFIACKNGHTEVVRCLGKKDRGLLSCQDNEGQTAFITAFVERHLEIAQLFLDIERERDASCSYITLPSDDKINQQNTFKRSNSILYKRNENGLFTMTEVIGKGDIRGIEFLFKEGVDWNLTDNMGRTAFFSACQWGQLDLAQSLIIASKQESLTQNPRFIPLNISLKDKQGWTALHAASAFGRSDIVAFLIKGNMKINEISNKGYTPIYLASEAGHNDVLDILIEKGANINTCAFDKSSPLVIASKNGHADVVDVLLKNKSNINSRTSNGYTALDLACKNGHIEIVEKLISNGSNVNDFNDSGHTPLYYAVLFNQETVASKLIEKGADKDSKFDDCTFPEIACLKGYINIALLFVDFSQSNMCPFLFVACAKGYIEIVRNLLNDHDGFSIDMCDKIGQTLITYAVAYEQTDIISLLIEKNADVNKQEGKGWTPLQVACDRGHESIVSLLLRHKTDPTKCQSKNQSPMKLAKKNKNIKKMLKESIRCKHGHRMFDLI